MKRARLGLLLPLGLSLGTAPVVAQTWVERDRLHASVPTQLQYFGEALALSGDTLVAAALPESLATCPFKSARTGVHLFRRGATGWSELETIVGPPQYCAPGQNGFGHSVAIAGGTLVVGAPGDGYPEEGRAYVFERDLGGTANWGQSAQLVASDPTPYGLFGYDVSICGGTIVIGSNNDAAYVYERDHGGAGAWGEVARLTSPSANAFGISVAISGDTLAVGSPGASIEAGSAQVFERNFGGTGAWGEVRHLLPSSPTIGGYFGVSVAIQGDTLVVGAMREAVAGAASGAAYVFERDSGGPSAWGETRRLEAGDPGVGEHFGASVALAGDRIAVSAPRDKNVHSTNGSGYVFARNLGGSNAWSQEQKLVGSIAGGLAAYDNGVALSDDVLVLGAPMAGSSPWFDFHALAFDPNRGVIYGAYDDDWLMSLDPVTGKGDVVGPIGFDDVHGLAFDPSTDTLYGSSTGSDELISIDLATGSGTLIGAIGFKNVRGLAYDPVADVLYGADRNTDQLIRIDTTTGVGAAVGSFGGAFGLVHGLAFDPISGTLYGCDTGTDDLLTVNRATGLATAVGPMGSFPSVDGLTFDPGTGTLFGVDRVRNELATINTATGSASVKHALYLSSAGAAFAFELAVPSTYCTAGTSASGCTALISATGAASATASTGFELVAASVEGAKNGLFFFGANGRQASPWGNGTSYQCVVRPVERAGLLVGSGTSGGCDGSFAQDLNALWCSTCPKPGLNPGTGATVQAQLWYRDSLTTSNQTTSLSDAIEFVVAP